MAAATATSIITESTPMELHAQDAKGTSVPADASNLEATTEIAVTAVGVPDVTIRRAVLADAAALSKIGESTFCETFGHLYAPKDLSDYLAEAYALERTCKDILDECKAAWLVEAGSEVIGYAQAGPCHLPHPEATADCGEIYRFYLKKGWHNGGLGSRLFHVVLGWLLEKGPRDIWIGVWSENYGAQRFYGRQGFEKVGEYGFAVGTTVDREFIVRRRAETFSTTPTLAPATVAKADFA